MVYSALKLWEVMIGMKKRNTAPKKIGEVKNPIILGMTFHETRGKIYTKKGRDLGPLGDT